MGWDEIVIIIIVALILTARILWALLILEYATSKVYKLKVISELVLQSVALIMLTSIIIYINKL